MAWGALFTPHSPRIQAIAGLFNGFLILAAIIFLVVAGLVTYAVVRYRARAGAADPPQTFGSRTAEVAWTAIPLLIVLALFVFTVRTMAYVDAPLDPAQPPDVQIVGHQWWWEARYLNGAVTAHEIHIPAARRLLVQVDAADVIHDFWAPELARKMDAVPGRHGFIWLEADRPGTYAGACSEFCGQQHAWMRFQVIAESEADFSAWLAHQASAPPEPIGLGAEGAQIFRDQKCGDCHAVSPADTAPRSGPPLTHIASRKLLGGEIPNTPENLTRWIATPQSVKPGNRMPEPQLSAAQIGALNAYLEAMP
jgi:cytochrome c oxidase subunit II